MADPRSYLGDMLRNIAYSQQEKLAREKELALMIYLGENQDARVGDIYLAMWPDGRWEWRRKDYDYKLKDSI